jgi:hypothetical protein
MDGRCVPTPKIAAMDLADVLFDLIGQVLSNPIVIGTVMVLVGALVAGWLLATVWAFRDMAHRSESALARYLAATWVLLSGPFLLPLSLPILGLLRPLETPSDGRMKRLIEALQYRTDAASTCPECAARLEAEWIRCPWCATWQARLCQRCERWAPADAEICPWCTWSPGESLEPPAVPVPVRPAEEPSVDGIPIGAVPGGLGLPAGTVAAAMTGVEVGAASRTA